MILLLKAIVKKSTNYAKLSGIKPDKRNDRLLCALKQCDQVIWKVENGFWRLVEKGSIWGIFWNKKTGHLIKRKMPYGSVYAA